MSPLCLERAGFLSSSLFGAMYSQSVLSQQPMEKYHIGMCTLSLLPPSASLLLFPSILSPDHQSLPSEVASTAPLFAFSSSSWSQCQELVPKQQDKVTTGLTPCMAFSGLRTQLALKTSFCWPTFFWSYNCLWWRDHSCIIFFDPSQSGSLWICLKCSYKGKNQEIVILR